MGPTTALFETEGASGGGILETEKTMLRLYLLCFPNTSGESLKATGAEPPTTTEMGASA
jgi:hypothetical protein